MLTGLKELSDLGSPQVHLTHALKSAWTAFKYSNEQPFLDSFSQNLSDAQFAELADVIGFDPRTLTKAQLAEAQALANFIWEDSETRNMLLAFAKDYIAAQHRLELTEVGAGIATEVALDILLTALTLGTGATLVVASKVRHLNKFRQIGLHLQKLAKKLKDKAAFKQKSASTGGKVEFELEKPEYEGGELNKDGQKEVTDASNKTSITDWSQILQFWNPPKVLGNERVGMRKVFQRDDLFDPNAVVDGISNLERMQKGRPPIGFDGERINLHHLIQKEPGTIVEIGGKFHSENSKIIHGLVEPKSSFRYSSDGTTTAAEKAFNRYKYWYWKQRAEGFNQ